MKPCNCKQKKKKLFLLLNNHSQSFILIGSQLNRQPCQQGLEDTDCIVGQGLKLPSLRDILGMSLYCIWEVWSTPLLALLPDPCRSRLDVPVKVPFMDEINFFENY